MSTCIRLFLPIAASGVFASSFVLAAQTVELPPATEAQFKATVAKLDALYAAEAVKGGSYLLRYDLDGRSFVKGYGHLDCARTTPMRPDALIDSGSITKLFTIAAIYKLVEEGRLKLDDPLGAIFPGVPADKRAITISQLVNNRSGMPDVLGRDSLPLREEDSTLEKLDYGPLSKREMLKIAWGARLEFKPGAKRQYSNFGFQILAAVIEKVSGQDYESYVRSKILLPAGMKDTGYRLPDFAGKVFADQCRKGASWTDPVTKGLWKNGVSWYLIGAGGMMTTLDDLYRWTRATTSGVLFRPDIQDRFERSWFFRPAFHCNSELSKYSGSNALTQSDVAYLPTRKESVIFVRTRSDYVAPEQETLGILCPKPASSAN